MVKTMLKRILMTIIAAFTAIVIGFNIWGASTLGTQSPQADAYRDDSANRVVLVTGATGSVGDGLLKAAMLDDDVETIYALTRRMSPRLEQGKASGRVQVIMHMDFTDYTDLADSLAQVNTVMWGLGTTSIGMDPELYRTIHFDFPVNFVKQWLAARTEGPMAFHYVTGMGNYESESADWAKVKGGAERRVAEMAEGTGLRTFGHRSAWIRPTEENANLAIILAEPLLKPGYLVIRGVDLGRAMLEISARTEELPSGVLIDNRDAIEYAEAYRDYMGLN
jgi:hypothetical protein